MLNVVLYRPEIPPNTGNVIRLCANAGAALHLIEPLGFALDDARLRRAGLDYREYADVRTHPDLDACLAALGHPRVLAFSARGGERYDRVAYAAGDALLFGPESAGLPPEALAAVPGALRVALPMRPGQRSLNLSNAVAVAVFEAWRQWNFAGSGDSEGDLRPTR
jgi:tRNA (cytidine/uridine-2'-O-)-methyltransferase